MLSLLPTFRELLSNLWMPNQTPLMNAISMNNLGNLGLNSNIVNENPYFFNNEISNKNLPITNQRSSGRCWLFATCNLIRTISHPKLVEKYGEIEDFELSQNYLFFWDKFERYHRSLRYFIEINKNEEELKDRYMYQLYNDPLGDGGQWDMAKEVIKKYGVVPKSVYPDTHHSKSSRQMNKVLTAQLKSDFLKIKDLLDDPSLEDTINVMLKRVYKMLISFLGKPPNEFDWQFKNTKNKISDEKGLTPLSFLKLLDFDPDEWVSLVNDPRETNPYGYYYEVKYLGNVLDKHVGWLNVDMDRLTELTKKSLDENIPVWFGCDMGAETDSKTGVKHPGIIDLKGLLGTDIVMSKEERLLTYSSLPNHAMMITGYHENNNKILRWKIENSWGKDSGKDGFCLMTNEWMNEFVYQILIKKSMLSDNEIAAIDENSMDSRYSIEPWDPLGTLAKK